ncbi:MAG: hypothetical protein M5U22_20645 [Thermoleophilia bacterium]|nr:hypothetical protein [Thermoleophilia bacterium]
MEYVAEKARHSLEQLHEVLRLVERKDSAALPARAAFQYGLASYLALQNMLDVANDHQLVDRLLGMEGREFRNWLGAIASEGSVTG